MDRKNVTGVTGDTSFNANASALRSPTSETNDDYLLVMEFDRGQVSKSINFATKQGKHWPKGPEAVAKKRVHTVSNSKHQANPHNEVARLYSSKQQTSLLERRRNEFGSLFHGKTHEPVVSFPSVTTRNPSNTYMTQPDAAQPHQDKKSRRHAIMQSIRRS